MNTDEAARPCAGEWTKIEARFQSAKQTLLDAQRQHCDAAHEFLLARAQVRRMLETVFPGAEEACRQPVSETRCDCDEVAAQQQRCPLDTLHAAP